MTSIFRLTLLLVTAASVAMTSSHSVSWRAGKCPCYVLDKTIRVCAGSSLKSIPDCLPSNTTRLIVKSPGIPLVAETFQRFTNLWDLRIEHLKKPQLAKDMLKYLPRLSFFQLYKTDVDYVDSEWFMYAPHLRTVSFRYTNIPYLAPDTFGYLPLLNTVRLNNNRLTSLSPDIFKGLSVKSLYLKSNPWHCDCELARFIQWTRDNDVNIVDNPSCAQPSQLNGKSLKKLTLADTCTGPHY